LRYILGSENIASEARMTYILRKMKMAKLTYIFRMVGSIIEGI
jgi:hypothetical protein